MSHDSGSSSPAGSPWAGRSGVQPTSGGAAAAGECPVKHGQNSAMLNPANMMVPESQVAAPGQRVKLSAERQASTIPMSDFRPEHQVAGTQTWTYPSPQQFYNAMVRKGWHPDARDMDVVVAIHNSVNEQSWREIMKWEALHFAQCADPKLKRFMGRPTEPSPKARFNTFMGAKEPFDRHDWIVDRCGTDVRYIIDFYHGKPVPDKPVSMHLDVRPALDSVASAYDRLRMWAFPPDFSTAQAAASAPAVSAVAGPPRATTQAATASTASATLPSGGCPVAHGSNAKAPSQSS